MSIVQKTDRTNGTSSVMSLAANLGAQLSKLDDRDRMSSLVVAQAMVESVVAKTLHIKYMEELEKKIKPYVISGCTEQSMKLFTAVSLTHDNKVDDHLLSAQIQE